MRLVFFFFFFFFKIAFCYKYMNIIIVSATEALFIFQSLFKTYCLSIFDLKDFKMPNKKLSLK